MVFRFPEKMTLVFFACVFHKVRITINETPPKFVSRDGIDRWVEVDTQKQDEPIH